MDFVITNEELAALCGVPHIQQLAYLRGIRPYMDVKTGIVGVMRKISYQSIAEQLYIEPHQGIKSQSWSRDQIRRAVAGLARVGMIEVQSEGMQLILKCPFAARDFSVQNKAAINPPQKATTRARVKNLENTGFFEDELSKADTEEPIKAAIPLNKDNYYIFLLSQFEQFWNLYPLKKSQQKAWEAFQALNPTAVLCAEILSALQAQLTHTAQLKSQGQWVAAWKYPANWLAQQCWNDELTRNESQEHHHATHKATHQHQDSRDLLWDSCKAGVESDEAPDNIIEFVSYKDRSQAY